MIAVHRALGFILGTCLARAGVVADWSGLRSKALFEGRDLASTMDSRALLKTAVTGTFDLTAAQLDRVCPGASSVRVLPRVMS